MKEYLVRWEGYGDKHDSWEPTENLSNLVEEMAAFDLAKEKETCRAQQLWQQHLMSQALIMMRLGPCPWPGLDRPI